MDTTRTLWEALPPVNLVTSQFQTHTQSAVRRVINLRFKAPGSFWTERTVSGLMHLRAAFKAGRWDEVMIGVLTGTFQTPSFAPVSQAATHRSAEAQKRDTPQAFIKSRKQAA